MLTVLCLLIFKKQNSLTEKTLCHGGVLYFFILLFYIFQGWIVLNLKKKKKGSAFALE